jgi:phosphoribosylformimino-5-aminoimidazole carboxamide ribotide isomerase
MEIIPVIDLKNGSVVRARMGQRSQYHPIRTPLSPTSRPVDVARGLLSVHPFTSLYVADLDAIERIGNNRDALTRLKSAFPGLALWVDGGIGDLPSATAWLAAGLGDLVLGSESQADAGLVGRLADHDHVVLSLDFRGDVFQGPPALAADAACWPQRVIAMTLGRVGSGSGPDLGRLHAVQAAAAGRRVFAAGGVRNGADLAALDRLGLAGALVASCLHDGALRGPDIAALDQGQAEVVTASRN